MSPRAFDKLKSGLYEALGYARGYGDALEELKKHLMDTTVSCQSTTITMECGSQDTKDALMDILTKE